MFIGSEDSISKMKDSSLPGLESESEPKGNVAANANPLKRHKKISQVKCTGTANKKEKYRKCPHCDYKSTILSHLKVHIMSQHTDEKPYECPHCDFKSASSCSVK